MRRWTLWLLLWLLPFELQAGAPLLETEGDRVGGEYVVVFENPFEVQTMTERMQDEMGVTVLGRFEGVIHGAHVAMSPAQLDAVLDMDGVRWVEENALLTLSRAVSQANPLNRGLDRIDQQTRALDQLYRAPASGQGVNIYVVDSGINPTHVSFGGRASVGADVTRDPRNGIDCNGHGTHVAGIAGSADFGVAKDVNLIAVRAFDCSNSSDLGTVLRGLDWVFFNLELPAVVNLSFGGPASLTLDNAVDALFSRGAFTAVAAGNEATDACLGSPARAPTAFGVGATAVNDRRTGFSNFGRCVELFAPGLNITSTWFRSPTDVNTISGTSMSSPHVAGAAALLLEGDPSMSPTAVGRALIAQATAGTVIDPGPGSPNLLLNVSGLGAGGPAMSMPFMERFALDAGAFVFQPDAFGTAAPRYVSGGFVPNAAADGGGALVVQLGGVDDADIVNMSGGHTVTLRVTGSTSAVLEFTFRIRQSGTYEADELTTGVVALDGAPLEVFGRLEGDGNDGPDLSTGFQAFSVPLGELAAGDHTITIGLFNNKKTLLDEVSDMVLDDVAVRLAP